MGIRSQLDRILDDTIQFLPQEQMDVPARDLALDMLEKESEFAVRVSIPIMKAEEIDVTLRNNTLTGVIKYEVKRKGELYHLRKRRYGAFSRSVRSPMSVEEEAIEATYSQGILTLRLRSMEEGKPKRIVMCAKGQ